MMIIIEKSKIEEYYQVLVQFYGLISIQWVFARTAITTGIIQHKKNALIIPKNGLIIRLLCIFVFNRVLCLISLLDMDPNTDGVCATGIHIFKLLFGIPIDAKNMMLPYESDFFFLN